MVFVRSETGSPKHGYIEEFVVDTKQDLEELLEKDRSMNMGCTAFVIDEMSFYILNGNKQWVKIQLTQ